MESRGVFSCAATRFTLDFRQAVDESLAPELLEQGDLRLLGGAFPPAAASTSARVFASLLLAGQPLFNPYLGKAGTFMECTVAVMMMLSRAGVSQSDALYMMNGVFCTGATPTDTGLVFDLVLVPGASLTGLSRFCAADQWTALPHTMAVGKMPPLAGEFVSFVPLAVVQEFDCRHSKFFQGVTESEFTLLARKADQFKATLVADEVNHRFWSTFREVYSLLSYMSPDLDRRYLAVDGLCAIRKGISSWEGREAVTVIRDLLDLRDGMGMSFLHHSAWSGSLLALEMALGLGANIDSADKSGMTGLHYAAVMGLESAVHLLLRANANVQSKTVEGQTAVSLAAAVDYRYGSEVTDILLKAGAELAEVPGKMNENINVLRSLYSALPSRH